MSRGSRRSRKTHSPMLSRERRSERRAHSAASGAFALRFSLAWGEQSQLDPGSPPPPPRPPPPPTIPLTLTA